MKQLIGFKVWCAGDNKILVYRSSDCITCLEDDWKALPDTILVVVLYRRDSYRTIIKGGDWYWPWDYVPSREWGVDELAPSKIDPSLIKKGIAVSDELYKQAYEEALNDRAW